MEKKLLNLSEFVAKLAVAFSSNMYVQLPFEVFLTLLIVVLLMIAAKLEKQLPEIQEITSFFDKFLNLFHGVFKHIIVGASVLSNVPSSC